VVKLVDTLS